LLLQLPGNQPPVVKASLHEAGAGRKQMPGRAWPLARVLFLILLVFTTAWLWLAGVGDADDHVPATAPSCAAVATLAGDRQDAGPVLQACLDATPAHGTVALSAGRYRIATPVHIRRAVTLTTHGLARTAPSCFANEQRCALLHLAISPAATAGGVMPLDVTSDAVRLDHLVFQGTRLSDPAGSAKRCAVEALRPMAGGVRIAGNAVVVTRSVFRDMGCYTALEYGTGVGAVITDNAFVGNGTHNVLLGWADGLTIHTARKFRVSGNRFHDNTDVQLIFGSCIDCTVTVNVFTHGGTAAGGSFAELMLQAWPKATSGDYTGTQVTRNRIDCGAQRRCGFGIMIGSSPWYDAPAFGGSVTYNRVRGAMLALNIDYLTGQMAIGHNDLASNTGIVPSQCGPQRLTAVSTNVSPIGRKFLTMPAAKGTTFRHLCILN
jgi:hypothetical protein